MPHEHRMGDGERSFHYDLRPPGVGIVAAPWGRDVGSVAREVDHPGRSRDLDRVYQLVQAVGTDAGPAGQEEPIELAGAPTPESHPNAMRSPELFGHAAPFLPCEGENFGFERQHYGV